MRLCEVNDGFCYSVMYKTLPRICRATAASLKMFEARRLIGPEREEGGVTAKLMKSS